MISGKRKQKEVEFRKEELLEGMRSKRKSKFVDYKRRSIDLSGY